MYKVEIPCTVCSVMSTKTLPNKSSAILKYETGEKKCFCSKDCRKKWFEQKHLTKKCKHCHSEFRYFESTQQQFCCANCYGVYMKDHPDEYGLVEKATTMRKDIDKASATDKMLHTKLKKGLIVDWKNATWKQWYRRCNAILHTKRKEMLADWDGYDYISKEYIKDNLELPYYHKEYPTLDHVVPKQTLFLQGYTPEEACREENLRWTTRSNNSKKGYKLTE